VDRRFAIPALVALAMPFLGLAAMAQVRSGPASPASAPAGLGGMPAAAPSQGGPIVGGPPGASVGRIQPSLLRPPSVNVGVEALPIPERPPAHAIPVVRPLSPGAKEPPEQDSGPEGGITLDEALGRVVHDNLELRARFSDISQADSDVLTASLRTNPILYADVQQVPYGSYSSGITGGPNQYDINIVYPLDISHKREARTRAAVMARRFAEAQYKDAVRLTLDNLYGLYVDALVAQDNYDRVTKRKAGILKGAEINEPEQALRDTQRKLALLLNMTPEDVAQRQLHGRVGYRRDQEDILPLPLLLEIAMANRPDLAAGRLTVCLAEANLRAVLANRFDDVLVLYQPYTFKNGAPFDAKSGLAWALGVTVPLPIYNRQQGNLRKARQIVEQAKIRLASLQHIVESDVRGAVLEHEAAHQAYVRTFNEFNDFDSSEVHLEDAHLNERLNVPADDALVVEFKRLQSQLQSLRNDAEIDKLTKYYQAIVRHRKSMLSVNTVTGIRIVD
jgi:cobalt-zinc-cadmium efflux system outer membrane protein